MAASTGQPALDIATVAHVRSPSGLRDRLEVPLWIAGTGIVFLLAWEVYARVGGLNPLVFVGPSRVWSALVEDTANGQIPHHLAASAAEFGYAFLLAAAFGVPTGLLVGGLRRVEIALSPYLVGLYSLPVLAWLPVLITWFGIGLLTKVLLIFLICYLTITLNVMAGVKLVDPVLVKVGRSMGATRLELFVKVILPSTLPFVVTGLRLAVGRGVLSVFLAELVGASSGIGFYIMRSGTNFQIANVFAGVVVMASISVLLTEGIRYLETRLTPWRGSTQL